MTNEEILNAISEMSVLELSELVKAIEDKFGVSAAAPVAVAAAAPIFQIDPNTTAIIKKEEALRYLLDIYGVPNKLLFYFPPT